MGIIAYYIYDEMVDWETTYACHMISHGAGDRGKKIVAVSSDGRDKASCSGLRYGAQSNVHDIINEKQLEGLIIPGGYKHEDCADLYKFIRLLHEQRKLLAAICAGTIFLARAGILQDVAYTTVFSKEFFSEQKIKDPFPRQNYVDKDIVRDGHVLTAKYNAFLEFSVEINDWLGLFKNREEKTESLRAFREVRQ